MARNKIVLKSDPQPKISEDLTAAEAVIPGHWLKHNSGGTCSKNTSNADDVPLLVAVERDELNGGIDDAYAIGDCVKIVHGVPGNHLYMFLASGENIAEGAMLTGNNAGLLSATGVADGVRMVQALEAVNTTGSAPVAGTRIRVEVR